MVKISFISTKLLSSKADNTKKKLQFRLLMTINGSLMRISTSSFTTRRPILVSSVMIRSLESLFSMMTSQVCSYSRRRRQSLTQLKKVLALLLLIASKVPMVTSLLSI